jgi:hypothetical protein
MHIWRLQLRLHVLYCDYLLIESASFLKACSPYRGQCVLAFRRARHVNQGAFGASRTRDSDVEMGFEPRSGRCTTAHVRLGSTRLTYGCDPHVGSDPFRSEKQSSVRGLRVSYTLACRGGMSRLLLPSSSSKATSRLASTPNPNLSPTPAFRPFTANSKVTLVSAHTVIT